MFGRKCNHSWGSHVMVENFVNATVFAVVCEVCGKTGKYRVNAQVFDNSAQRRYVGLARKNGWFK